MEKSEAMEILRAADEDADFGDYENEIFTAIYGREPDQEDIDNGLISLCYAAI